MAVFTEVPFEEAAALVAQLSIGTLNTLEGCVGGIENTNYFADTTQGRYVLTVFERLSFEQLPFYLHLMQHLAHRGICVPEPRSNANGDILHSLCGKPATVVNRLRGSTRFAPTTEHCAQVGAMLAQLHLAALDYRHQQPHLRGLAWWTQTVPLVLPYLDDTQRGLMKAELAFQHQLASSPAYAALPRGVIHADLFRDNVLFDDNTGSDQLSGFFDFYFAGVDTLLFDLAVCLNDWCIDVATGVLDEDRAQAFVAAYDFVRPLDAGEQRLLPALLRAAAFRFWLSRLWDIYLPRRAEVLTAHDPLHFERVLSQRIEAPWHYLRKETLDDATDIRAATP